jgi:hypothetical protein
VSRREVLLEVLEAGRAGDRQRPLTAVQLPSQGDLLRGGVVLRGDRIEHGVERLALLASGHGAGVPGREDDAGVLGDLPHGGASADGDVVVDRHGGDVGDRQGRAELLGADIGETDVADEAVLSASPEIGTELFISPRTVEWHLNNVLKARDQLAQGSPQRAAGAGRCRGGRVTGIRPGHARARTAV